MTELSPEALRLVDTIRKLTDERDTLDDLIEANKADLRQHLDVGTYTEDGRPAVVLQPNRRFSASLAAQILPAHMLDQCKVETITSESARATLPAGLYRQCMVEIGQPKVILK